MATTMLTSGGQDVSNPVEVGPLIRLRTGPGFGPAIGFEWTRFELDTTIAGQRLPLGVLRVKPVMAGVGYSLGREPWQLSLTLVAGYAFTGLGVNETTRAMYRDNVGAAFASIETSGSFAWRARASLWYDIVPRIGLMAGVGYIDVQPETRFVTDTGVQRGRVRASSVIFTVGAVYGLF